MLDSIIKKLEDRVFVEDLRKTDSIDSKDDFTKTYTSKKKSLKIQNTDKSRMIDMELVSSYRMMVREGASVRVADIRLNDWKGIDNLFDGLEFYDRTRDYYEKRNNKQFTYKYVEEKFVGKGFDPQLHLCYDWENKRELCPECFGKLVSV